MVKAAKCLGIWMDHQVANLMEFTEDPIVTTIVHSKFTHEAKELAIGRSENLMHKKEQNEQTDYYWGLGDIIMDYDHIILFGPTDAKLELYNTLKADHRFGKIKIEVRQADKMTENQQHAYVRGYFTCG